MLETRYLAVGSEPAENSAVPPAEWAGL